MAQEFCSMEAVVRREAQKLAAAVYGIWCNRNACYFSLCSNTPLCLVKMISLSLKARFFGCLSQQCLAKNRSIAELVRSL